LPFYFICADSLRSDITRIYDTW